MVLAIIGTGVGFTFQPTLVALQSHVPRSRRAVVTSNRNFFRCAGGAFGLAVSAAVLQKTLRTHLPSEFAYLADSTYSLQQVTGSHVETVLNAYMAASHAVFILQVPLIAICFLACWFIMDRGMDPPSEAGPDGKSEGTILEHIRTEPSV